MNDDDKVIEEANEKNILIQKLIQEGNYAEVLKILNQNDKEDLEMKHEQLPQMHDISNLNMTTIENAEDPHNTSYAPSHLNLNLNDNDDLFNHYEAVAKERHDHEMEMVVPNLKEEEQILSEEEEQNRIEIKRIQEVYQMNKEESTGNWLQVETRKRIFPHLNDRLNFDKRRTHVLGTERFKNFKRASFLSAYMISNAEIEKVFNYAKENEIMNLNIGSKSLKNILSPENLKDAEIIKEEPQGKIPVKKNKKKLITVDYICEYENYQIPENENTLASLYKEFSHMLQQPSRKIKSTSNLSMTISLAYQAPIVNDEEKLRGKIKSWIKHLNIDDNNIIENDTNLNFQKYNHMFLNFYSNISGISSQLNQNSSAPCLIELVIAGKQLKRIPNEILMKSPYLRILNLEENHIDKIDNLHFCQYLISLNFNKNLIHKIENIDTLKNLERVSLNANSILILENLSENKKLKSISLGRNKITSIDNLENEVMLVEEITLCENLIKTLPRELALPYVRYLDLNENKISNLPEIFICPNLEKLLLKDNKISLAENRGRADCTIGYCSKLREIDLSFNKIESFSSVLSLLSRNFHTIEVVNVINNPFTTNLKGLVNLAGLLKKIFQKLKMVNNESITSDSGMITKRSVNTKMYLLSYFNLFHQQNAFLKNFNALYFSTSIYDRFNFNSNLNLNTQPNIEKFYFIDMINHNYFLFKKHHLEQLVNIVSQQKGLLSKNISLQYEFMKYLYQFKFKVEYIAHSLIIFRTRFKIRKKKKLNKIKYIQQYVRVFLYHKHFLEQMKGIQIIDDDDKDADELINFFMRGEEQRSNVIEDIVSAKIMPVIKEESDMKINPIEIASQEDSSGSKFKFCPQIIKTHHWDHSAQMNIVSINDQATLPKILGNTTDRYKLDTRKSNQSRDGVILPPIQSNILQVSTTSTVNENNLSSNEKLLSASNSIKVKLAVPLTKKSSKAVSDYSCSNISSNNPTSQHAYGRLLPQKIFEAIRLLEEECKIAIKKAKGEWKFTNSQAEALLENKIRKQYKKKINKIFEGL